MTQSIRLKVQTKVGPRVVPAYPVGRVYVHRHVRLDRSEPFEDLWVISTPTGLVMVDGITSYQTATKLAQAFEGLIPSAVTQTTEWTPAALGREVLALVVYAQNALAAGYGIDGIEMLDQHRDD